MDSTATLEEDLVGTLKSALAARTWVEVLLAEALATTEVLVEEGCSRIPTLGEEEVIPMNNFTKTVTQWIRVIIALLAQARRPLRMENGTVIQMRITITISRVLDLATTITDIQTPFESASLRRRHQAC